MNLKVLKDRNFAIGCLLIFLFGIGDLFHRYGASAVLPGTARLYRLHRRAGGRAARAGSDLRYAGDRVPLEQGGPALLMTFGFFTFGLTTLYFGNVTLDVSPTTLLLPDPDHRLRAQLRLRADLDRGLRHAEQRADRQRQRLVQPDAQRRRLDWHFDRADPADAACRTCIRTRSSTPCLRLARSFRTRCRRRSTHSARSSARTTPAVPAVSQLVPAVGAAGEPVGFRRRLPLAFAALLLLCRRGVAAAPGQARSRSRRRALECTKRLTAGPEAGNGWRARRRTARTPARCHARARLTRPAA